jgi:hypothetical protein
VFAAEDIDAMTDDECIATAMLLGATFSVWSKAGWHCCQRNGAAFYNEQKALAARGFLEAHSSPRP